MITRDLELVNLELDLLSENHTVKDTGTDLYLHKFHPYDFEIVVDSILSLVLIIYLVLSCASL